MRRKPPAAPALRRRNLPLMMLQAREHVIGYFRPILNAHGITEQQWRIVRLLLDTGPLEPHEIGELCRLSSPSLAGVLSRMENMGFVQRKRLADDQRRVLVSLTPRSRALASRMAPLIEAVYARIEDLLGKEFAEDFYRVLDELIEKLGPESASTRRSISTEMREAP
jgi:homoprotocatechuate degradation regulator HpaR